MAAIAAPVPEFDTPRLSLRRWRSLAPDAGRRAALEAELGAVLTPRVLAHLPVSLQLGPGPDPIAGWIDDRVAESDLFVALTRPEGRIAGVLILAAFRADGGVPEIHIGYLLAEAHWGKGLATELLTGLIGAAGAAGPLLLLGGVDRANSASARVLEKAGFRRDPDLSDGAADLFVRDLR
ncbi:GNAT family N-acetyltransferase [Defluviimonas salinarum]|uniref:GNAT family N-acetyltransferase n=1 Tax=Defluviimonas salinarum TaxID=2992147 RepID=A0ABT3J5A3_9RHOB|nr:GNAT family N-acetyltransferase [Defluviimonas salinarum]MCW3782849.1 GNAT family N-acetyltransferase [Defluviimonas salinarum]